MAWHADRVSNPETAPEEVECGSGEDRTAQAVTVLLPRDVPLGGARAMTVRRTLPQRHRSLVGAWCFADHYGPDAVAETGGMVVPPHPHTGLQTVSWLFTGVIEHRDSGGHHAMVRPGELNLMTGGSGVAHSEVSTPGTDVLHGVQLWVALPEATRNAPRDFVHYAPPSVSVGTATARVFLGTLAGSTSPVATHTPLLGAEIELAGGHVDLQVDPTHEHAVLVDRGEVAVEGAPVGTGALGYLPTGRDRLRVDSRGAARILLIGGAPLEEDILMWWNFVGRSHEEIAEFRQEWQQRGERFGVVPGYAGEPSWLPAPLLPTTTLRPRRR